MVQYAADRPSSDLWAPEGLKRGGACMGRSGEAAALDESMRSRGGGRRPGRVDVGPRGRPPPRSSYTCRETVVGVATPAARLGAVWKSAPTQRTLPTCVLDIVTFLRSSGCKLCTELSVERCTPHWTFSYPIEVAECERRPYASDDHENALTHTWQSGKMSY